VEEKMNSESDEIKPVRPTTVKIIRQGGGGSPVYGIGMIGAWMYFWKGATTNQEKAMAVLKGFVWPAILVYELFMFLKKPAE
jgi:hypothetical protein